MTTYECPRCNGTGTIKEYGHISNGTCFKCSGTGRVSRKSSTKRRRGPDPRIAAENSRRTAKANELYKADPRLTVTADHPCYYMHSRELAEKDGIWEGL